MATVSIPLLLKELTGGAGEAEVEGATLGEIITALDALYPGIADRICSAQQISPTVALVVDGTIASMGLNTPVQPESHVNILPSFGGG